MVRRGEAARPGDRPAGQRRAAGALDPPSARHPPLTGANEARGVCLGEGAIALLFCGHRALAEPLIDELERVVIGPPAVGIEVLAKLHAARAVHALGASDPGVSLVSFEAAVAAYEKAGNGREACSARGSVGCFYRELGDAALAEKTLRKARADAERLGLHSEEAAAARSLGHALADLGRFDEAHSIESAAIAAFERMSEARMEGAGRTILAKILLMTGRARDAEREARIALDLLRVAPPLRAFSGTILSKALLAQGRERFEEGVATAYEAILQLERHGAEEGESTIRLVYAEALAASGAQREAQGAIASARHVLLLRAEKIKNRSWRERFLRHAPENVRTLELAELWAR